MGKIEEIERRVQALATTNDARQHIALTRFLDHARDDVPWLLARVRELEAELQRHDKHAHGGEAER